MITKKRIQMSVITFIAMIVLNIFAVSAITGSIGNARMVLYPEVNGWTYTTIDKTILTKNVNDAPINVTLRVGDESKDFIKLIDESYILQPNEEKKARFQIKVKKEGNYEGGINVFFSAVEGKEAGVVLPSAIIVIAKKNHGDNADTEVIDEEDVGDNTLITGDVIGRGGSGSSGIIFLSTSTLILFVILITLIYLDGKKKKKESEVKDIKKNKKERKYEE